MKATAFAKSSALLLGQIGPVKRARVSDLVSFDLDRPAGPSQRVPLLNLHYIHCMTIILCYSTASYICYIHIYIYYMLLYVIIMIDII